MAIFRVERDQNFSVVANYHIFDSRISLKAKGLLSIMLSLPENWNYTMTGLATITGATIDIIKSGVNELVETGYIDHRQLKDEKGRFGNTEYIVYEKPHSAKEPGRKKTYGKKHNDHFSTFFNGVLRSKSLSLKNRGLLSIMLSLPEDWCFNAPGLTTFCKDGIKAVRTGIKDLEKMGFIERFDIYDKRRKIQGKEYRVFEDPSLRGKYADLGGKEASGIKTDNENTCIDPKAENGVADAPKAENGVENAPKAENVMAGAPKVENGVVDAPKAENVMAGAPKVENGVVDAPKAENGVADTPEVENEVANAPKVENGVADTPKAENGYLVNNNIYNTKLLNNLSINHTTVRDSKRGIPDIEKEREEYEEMIKDNIAYDTLCYDYGKSVVDEIVTIMTDVVCSNRATYAVNRGQLPSAVIKSRFLKLNQANIAYVLDSLSTVQNTVRNPYGYLLTTIFNSSATAYTEARINFNNGKEGYLHEDTQSYAG